MKRGSREKFDQARREISVNFHHCSTPSGEFAASLGERKEKKRSLLNLVQHPTLLSDGLVNLQLSLMNRRFCRSGSTSCSFPSRPPTPFLIEDLLENRPWVPSHSRNTWGDRKRSRGSRAIAARAQLDTAKECVDYVLAEPLCSVEKRPTSPRPSAKDSVSPTIARLIPLSFARIVRSESSSRFRSKGKGGGDCSDLK